MRIILNGFEDCDIAKIHGMLADMIGNKYKSCAYTFKDNSSFYAKTTKNGISISKEQREESDNARNCNAGRTT